MPESGAGELTTSPAPSALDSELLAAIKRSYPDASQMPNEIKLMVEKSQSQLNKQTTRELHLATTQLGKAKKCFDELTESRGAHRKAWMGYLKECTDSLTKQQEKFNEQEKQFTELMDKAKSEMQTARKTIQALSANSGTSQEAEAPAPAVEPASTELQELQQQADRVLKASSEALLKLKTEKIEPIDLSMEDDEEDEEGRRSRSRTPKASS